MMDYYLLADFAAQIGYRLAMAGAETFRVEDTIRRVLHAYGLECEVFAIPNSLTVSFEAANGKPLTILKRIGGHKCCERLVNPVPELRVNMARSIILTLHIDRSKLYIGSKF